MNANIRSISTADKAQWRSLWAAYLEFDDMADEQRELTWQRLLDPASQMKGLVAENGGQIIGFAHYVFHLAAWVKHQSCYLQDLFVSSSIRGKGLSYAGIFCLTS